MENKPDIKNHQLDEIYDFVLNTNNVLSKLMDYQMSLELQLQEIIKSNGAQYLTIKSTNKIDFIPIKEIIYCSANLSYTEIITENHGSVLASKAISEFNKRLINYNFYKISKSSLINVKKIHSYNRKTNEVTMKNHDVLQVARRRKNDFLTFMET